MADKSKKRARALMAKSGMSYQAAKQALSNAPSGPRINLIHSFRWDEDPSLKLSAQCPSCLRWIHCREHLQEAACFCGEPYRVVFDREPDWTMKQGPACLDCGEEFRMREKQQGRNPWRPINLYQIRCGVCSERAYHVEHIARLEAQARGDMVHQLDRWAERLQGADATALLLLQRAYAELAEVDRFHLARMEKLLKLKDDVTADTPIDDPEYRAASERLGRTFNELTDLDYRQRSSA